MFTNKIALHNSSLKMIGNKKKAIPKNFESDEVVKVIHTSKKHENQFNFSFDHTNVSPILNKRKIHNYHIEDIDTLSMNENKMVNENVKSLSMQFMKLINQKIFDPIQMENLLNQGADINYMIDDVTLLFCACEKYFSDQCIDFLLQHGADPNIICFLKRTALHMAIINNCKLHVINLLLNYGANPNIKTGQGNTPLRLAIEFYRSLEIIKSIVHSGGDVNEKMEGEKSLFANVNNCTPNEIVEFLLENGIEITSSSLSRIPNHLLARCHKQGELYVYKKYYEKNVVYKNNTFFDEWIDTIKNCLKNNTIFRGDLLLSNIEHETSENMKLFFESSKTFDHITFNELFLPSLEKICNYEIIFTKNGAHIICSKKT